MVEEVVTKVAVIGCGTMGTGICIVLLNNNFQVKIFGRSEESLTKGLTSIKNFYERGVKKGKVTQEEVSERLSKLRLIKNYEELGDSEIVFETVVENKNIKRDVLEEIERNVSENTYIFTNTSSFSITALSRFIKRRERFLGFHFATPAPLMKLVEIIPGENTSTETLNFAVNFAKRIGKEPVVCLDSPGFILNRILLTYLLESVRLVEKNLAKHEDIDKVAKLAIAHATGPFEIMDLVGVDVILHIAESLYEQTGDDKFNPPNLLREMVAGGLLGRKSGKGFYSYT